MGIIVSTIKWQEPNVEEQYRTFCLLDLDLWSFGGFPAALQSWLHFRAVNGNSPGTKAQFHLSS